jgi:16S rRNA (adenine1518-N6/adenine1519-N6)-dimethyltransferase
VDSAVLLFLRRGERLSFAPENLSCLLRLCFQQRRKQMQRVLRCLGTKAEEALEFLKIPPASRPEELTLQQFHALSNLLGKNFPSDADARGIFE